jgi:TANFOR domain-containing protein
MYLHFKRIILYCCLLMTAGQLIAQPFYVNVSIAVQPPYSPHISDYTSQPGKIMATLMNTSPAGGSIQVYLLGSITGTGGINIYTDPAYKMPAPITLLPGQPFMLSQNNLEQVFSENHLIFEGITKQQVINGNGLPEDNYQICIRAYYYNTGQPASAEEPLGCAQMNITSVEPPIVLNPVCGDTITASNPQSLIMSWTMPAGTPMNTQYYLKIVEILPSERDPNDAMSSAGHPVFFESTLFTTSFIYGPSYPALVAGKRYAFAVTAIDPSGKTSYRNGGRSEVCSFVYKLGISVMMNTQTTEISPFENNINISGSFNNVTVVPPVFMQSTHIYGSLIYQYADVSQNNKYDLANANLRLVVLYAKGPLNGNGKIDYVEYASSTNMDNIPSGYTLGTARTDPSGNFSFFFIDDAKLGLVEHHIGGNGGEFSYDLYRVAMIYIEQPYQEFIANPNRHFIFNTGDELFTGPLTAVVRSYKLDVTVKPDNCGRPDLMWLQNNRSVLAGVNVYLCRKYVILCPGPNCARPFPKDDGFPDPNESQTSITGMKVVAMGQTNSQGVVTFSKIIWQHNPSYTYYIYADVNPGSELNYTMNAPIPFDPQLPGSGGIGNTIIDPGQVIASSRQEYLSNYYKTLKLDIVMLPNLPSVTGEVVDAKEPSVKIPGAAINLMERYQGPCNSSVLSTMWGYYWTGAEDYIQSFMESCIDVIQDAPQNPANYFDFEWNRYTSAGPYGKFAFTNLPIMDGWPDNKQVIGPWRKLSVIKTGYNASLNNLVNGYKPLNFGEKGQFLTIMLDRGARLKGRVIDGDNNNGVEASIRFLSDSSCRFTDSQGYFNDYPAMLLPNTKQYLLVSAEGFLNDTIPVTVYKNTMDLGSIKIFSKNRRLNVLVVEETAVNMGDFIRIKGADVEILNVTQMNTCKKKMGNVYMYYPCPSPMKKTTGADGWVSFSFVNAGDDNNQEYTVRVSMPPGSGKDYEGKVYTIKIPYSQHAVKIVARLKPAACITGKVFAAHTPVAGAIVMLDVSRSYLLRGENIKAGSIADTTDSQGNYTIHNVPVRSYKQTFWAIKSQSNFIGDSAFILINQTSGECRRQNFNLTVYNDMDITNLMGFPIAVQSLTPKGMGAEITGEFQDLKGNDQFDVLPGGKLTFTKLEIKPGTLKNAKGVPVAEPVTLPVKTNENKLCLSINKNFIGSVNDNKIGINLDKTTGTGSYGVIKGKVSLDLKSFNTGGFALPAETWLALNATTATDKLMIPVLHADPAVKKPANVPNGFYVCNGTGQAIKYSFSGFPDGAEAAIAKSFLKNDRLVLNTILHTNCGNVTPADLKIQLGDVEIKTFGPVTINNSNKLIMGMGYWTLDASVWNLGNDGIKINTGVIHAGLDITCHDLKLTNSWLYADQAKLELGNMKLLGVKDIVATGDNKGLTSVWKDGKIQWVISVSSSNPAVSAAYVKDLQGFETANPLSLGLIRMYSGEPNSLHLNLNTNTYKLFDLVNFTPDNGTEIEVLDKAIPQWCKVRGLFMPEIPETSGFAGNIKFEKQGNDLKFGLDNVSPLSFTHDGALAILRATSLSNQLMIAKGTVEEPNQLLPVKVTLTYSPSLTNIVIDNGEKILITGNGSKFFKNVNGGMKVQNNAWNNFWFEGEMVGMKGISENPNKVKFTLTGAITADGQTIKVSNISDDFPGLSIIYDYQNSRLIGSFSQALNLGAMHGTCNASILVDGNGWYFDLGGEMVLPILPGISGGAEFYGLIGDYNNVPPVMSGKYGSYKCLPSSFKNHISGFLLQAGGKVELLSGLHFDFVLASVDVGVDVGNVQRMWMSFDDAGNTYGIALLQYCHIYAEGGLEATCTSVSAGMEFEMGASGVYVSNGNYEINGCASTSFHISGKQCLGALGVCCDDCCASVGIGDPTVGLTLHYDNVNGVDYGITSSSCNKQCP